MPSASAAAASARRCQRQRIHTYVHTYTHTYICNYIYMVAPPWIHIFLGQTKETKPRDAPKSHKNKQINARLPKTRKEPLRQPTQLKQGRPETKKPLRKQKNQTKPSRRPKNQSSQTAFHHARVVQKPNSDKRTRCTERLLHTERPLKSLLGNLAGKNVIVGCRGCSLLPQPEKRVL